MLCRQIDKFDSLRRPQPYTVGFSITPIPLRWGMGGGGGGGGQGGGIPHPT